MTKVKGKTKRKCGVELAGDKCDRPKGHSGDHKDRSYRGVIVSWAK